ncbi:hypothetical protein QK289_14235 [Exiguobacterium antarcticum]|uniref:Uncharacterized protein n=1 Tax=Exiguobacterium antarcticum TaxID=132920 RepID=A0ABT6R5D7_9BACL|nr:hypothetical protein [Exiguobacterium antarcticum]MDI3236169.1 hypothetical protein [Exiguobacterium antarcticum]
MIMKKLKNHRTLIGPILFTICVIGIVTLLWNKVDDWYKEDPKRTAQTEMKYAKKLEKHMKAKREFKEYEQFVYSIYDDEKLDIKEAKKLYEIKDKYEHYVNHEREVFGSSDLIFAFDSIEEDIETIENEGYVPLNAAKLEETTKNVFRNLDQFTDEKIKETKETKKFKKTHEQIITGFRLILALLGVVVTVFGWLHFVLVEEAS